MNKIITELMKKYDHKTVSVLGTEYIILFKNPDENPVLKNLAGYCSNNTKELVINNSLEYFEGKTDEWITNDIKITIRHELIHAFFNESGLVISAVFDDGWSKNEEMVDWWSTQSPKIFKIFTELDLLTTETHCNKPIAKKGKKMITGYRYNQIKEKDNLGYESISQVCQSCWSRAECYAEGKEKYSGKCNKEICIYRDIDINIDENLKSCPMCGSDNIKIGLITTDSYGSSWYIGCQRCGLENSGFNIDKYSKKDIYDYWNNRKGN